MTLVQHKPKKQKTGSGDVNVLAVTTVQRRKNKFSKQDRDSRPGCRNQGLQQP